MKAVNTKKKIENYLKELGFKKKYYDEFIEYRIKINNEDYYFSFYSHTIFYNKNDFDKHWIKNCDYEGLEEFIKTNPDLRSLIRKHKISLLNG